MTASKTDTEQKSINTLLLGALVLSGLLMFREGPYFDNMVQGWRFFTMAFFIGALAGFLGWTQTFGIVPSFGFSAEDRQPWMAAFICALGFAAGGSYLNRTFATPTGQTIAVEVESVSESKDRSLVTVKVPGGDYRRYVFDKETAAAVKPQTPAQLGISRGALGVEFVATIAPQRQ